MASVTFSHWEPLRPGRDGLRRTVRRWTRLSLAATAVVFVFTIIAELWLHGLQAYYELPVEGVWARTGVTLPPNASIRGGTVNDLGYWDAPFEAKPPVGKTRVALLGGRATLAGDATSNFACSLEEQLDGVQIDHFGVPEGTPQAYAVQLQRDVFRFRPQFVLLCLSPADEVAAAHEAAGPLKPLFVRFSQALPDRPGEGAADAALRRLVEPVDYETYVRRRTAAVSVCQSAGSDSLERRWHDAQSGLQRIVRACGKRNIGVAVILAPSEFQLSADLAEALRRRAGIAAQQFDLDLPQRRWSALADHLQLASLDLLPTFRSADAVLYEPSSPDWNAKGCRLAADTTARWLRDRLSSSVAAAAQSGE